MSLLDAELDLSIDMEELEAAFLRVRENNGVPGSDGVAIEHFVEGKSRLLSQLKVELESGCWHPQPYKNVTIDKANGQTRLLAIPTVRDRVVHTWLAQRITPLLEEKFERCSYGYRPHRSYIDAIRRVEFLRDSGYQWVVDADIMKFFDHISQELLTQKVTSVIQEPFLCELIMLAITARQQQANGDLAFGMQIGLGIPQGSALSPVLANLYLDEFDETMLENGFEVVRYADDFLVHCKSERGAQIAMAEIKRIMSSLKLSLNLDKIRMTNFERGFSFLGVNFIDQLVLPLSPHTEQCWATPVSASASPDIDNEAEIEPEEESLLEPIESESDQYRYLNACIEDELDDLTVASPPVRQSLSQIAKLRTLYIQRQGSVIAMRQGQLRVTFKGEELQRFPASSLDMLWLFGNVHPTVAVIKHCLSHSIPMVFLSQSGFRHGVIGCHHCQNPELLRAQANELEQSSIILQRVRFIIAQKLSHQLQLLRRWQKQGLPVERVVVNGLLEARNNTMQCDSVDQLRGYEGIGAKFYFQQWKLWCHSQWNFKARNRRPPMDPVNALLSYGYQLLFNNISTLLEIRGLSPLFGYLHTQSNGFPSLALDMMEQWRPFVVDEIILRLILRQQLSPTDFTLSNQGCVLKKTARQLFVSAFEQRMQQSFTHPDLKVRTDLRRFIDLQIMELRKLILEKEGAMTPLRLR